MIQSNQHKGVTMATKTRSKMDRAAAGRRNPFYGKHHSKEWKRQESRRKKGKNNPMYGKKHRASTIRKMRQAMMRRLAMMRAG